jgi:hypothetical protein
MYFSVILAALVIVSAVFLLRQYLVRALDDDAPADAPLQLHNDDSTDTLQAA